MFNFPEIRTTRTPIEQAQKIIGEVHEYFEEDPGELSDKEAVDVLHACETFIRVHFRGRMEVLDLLIKQTIKKNTDRKYYSQDCY